MKLYACGVDWQHEIGPHGAPDLSGKVPLYNSIEDLKAKRKCWIECGIVELEVTLVKWAEKQDLFKVKE